VGRVLTKKRHVQYGIRNNIFQLKLQIEMSFNDIITD
jgi:hypothetical protein